ncbi:Hypothetical predicted protein [Pelobates cultripes]|uniref:Uncharacterized protein n=1 Tax=Pelobates cultripes TaxID=61616 RepID=A0AAD1WG67_PELCU|nr:Hypothetical predicted protein [Pelobates cultripes]
MNSQTGPWGTALASAEAPPIPPSCKKAGREDLGLLGASAFRGEEVHEARYFGANNPCALNSSPNGDSPHTQLPVGADP